MTTNKVRERRQLKHIKLPCYNIVVWTSDSGGRIDSDLVASHECPDKPFTAAMNALEAMILAHACAGVDIESPAYIEGIETAVQAVTDRLGD